ncbi:MAG: TonB-dependent receptor [Haliscomenobacter sp.]|nr:TonB-dependent receptor [Haliscomenobacter sp.]
MRSLSLPRYLSIGLLGFLPFLSFGHEVYKGRVVDARTQEPLQGATILAESLPYGTNTDEQGNFVLQSETPVEAIVVSFLGYETQRIAISGPERFVLIELQATAINLQQITISETPDPLKTLIDLDVRLRGVNSSQEVLRSVPGLVIAQHAGGGKAEQIFLRGFDIDHGTDIAIWVDGLPVNMVSHAHGQGYADLHFVIPELIQRVEFGKGPYNPAFGNFSTAGQVEFHTPDVPEQSLFKIQSGRFNTQRALAISEVLGQKARQNGQYAYVASEYQFTDGPFESPQNFNRLNLFGKYTYRMANGDLLRIQGSMLKSKWDASGQIPQRAIDRGIINRFGAIDDTEGGATSRSNLSAELTRNMPGDAFLNQQIYWVDYDFELYSNFTFFLNDPVNGDQIRQKEHRSIFGYQGKYERQTLLGPLRFTTTGGWGLRYDQVNDNELSRSLNRQTTTERLSLGDVNELNASPTLQRRSFRQRWTLQGALRLDFFRSEYNDQLQTRYRTQSAQKAFLGPKLSLVYDWMPNFQWFLKSGVGFHSNDTRVVVAQNGVEILPAAYGVDFGFNAKPAERVFFHLAAWYLFLQQEFVYVGDEAIVEPSGRTRRIGLDASLRYQLSPVLFADADLSLTNGRSVDDPEGADAIPLAPRLTSSGGLVFNQSTGFNGSFRYRYVQKRPANPEGTVEALGYFLLDAGVNYTRPKFEIGLHLENLLNADWNEAQFDTESRLFNELEPVSELHFTPGAPFFWKVSLSFFL